MLVSFGGLIFGFHEATDEKLLHAEHHQQGAAYPSATAMMRFHSGTASGDVHHALDAHDDGVLLSWLVTSRGQRYWFQP